jgi:hypothetical protein
MRRTFPLLVTVAGALVALAVGSEGRSSAAPAGAVAAKQRIAITVRQPLESRTGSFVLEVLTPGPLARDSGSTTFASGPAPVFTGRIVGGQRVDRFRGTDTVKGKGGTLTIRLQVDFVSAGNRYQVGTGTWSIVRGTGVYAGLTGGGRSALVNPPGKFGFARHEGFVTAP